MLASIYKQTSQALWHQVFQFLNFFRTGSIGLGVSPHPVMGTLKCFRFRVTPVNNTTVNIVCTRSVVRFLLSVLLRTEVKLLSQMGLYLTSEELPLLNFVYGLGFLWMFP